MLILMVIMEYHSSLKCSDLLRVIYQSNLAFTSEDLNRFELDGHTLKTFPRSQHWPLLTTALKNLAPVQSDPYKSWNFHKASWKLYGFIIKQVSQELPSLDSSSINEAYQDFCNIILAAAKLSIRRGRRDNYRPCWDAESKHLYQVFLLAP